MKSDSKFIDRLETGERPQHKVVITKPFRMSATEVSIGQFKKFAIATGYQTEAEKAEFAVKNAPPGEAGAQPPVSTLTYLNPGYAVRDDLPAAFISWNDAVAYCQWLGEQEKTTYRLPTEAEWEYGCRAGTTTQYSFGDDSKEMPKYGWHSGRVTHPVGMLRPNPFGLFDMHGNLAEHCGDYWQGNWYERSSPNDPSGPYVGSDRVIRGGHRGNPASYGRSASRSSTKPSDPNISTGFRSVSVW